MSEERRQISDTSESTHFVCDDCGRDVLATYCHKGTLCLSCQFLRDHDVPQPTAFGWVVSATEAGKYNRREQ
jgi:ribosomal protein L37E